MFTIRFKVFVLNTDNFAKWTLLVLARLSNFVNQICIRADRKLNPQNILLLLLLFSDVLFEILYMFTRYFFSVSHEHKHC